MAYLIVDLAQGGRHLIGQRACDNHNVTLTRGRPEHDPQAVLVVARRRDVHHLDRAARKPARVCTTRPTRSTITAVIEILVPLYRDSTLDTFSRDRVHYNNTENCMMLLATN
jgi:hypothetical protein